MSLLDRLHHIVRKTIQRWIAELHTTMDSIGLLVRDLNAEFFLNCHYYLNGIQAVQTKIVHEVRCT